MRTLRRIGAGGLALVILALLAFRFWPDGSGIHELSAEEQAFAESITVPPMPADWTWHEFESFDGTTLRWGETGNGQSARATWVYVPGYNGTIEAYGEQFDLWARRGYHVVGLDMRGQGGSGGNTGNDKLPRLIADGEVPNARDILGFLRALPRVPDQPLVLSGSSYGGLATTLALMEDPGVADAYLAIAPAYHPKLPGDRATLTRVFKAGTVLGRGDKYGPEQGPWVPFGTSRTAPDWCPTTHPRIYTQLAIQSFDPDQRVGGLSWGVLRDWAVLGDEILAGERGRLEPPTRMVTSAEDALVENGPIREVCEAGAACSHVEWEDATHCVTLDRDELLERVADEVDALVEGLE